MSTGRLVLYTDSYGSLKGLPKFPPDKRVDVVFRITDPTEAPGCPRRFSNPEIGGKIEIMSDVFDTLTE
jgi:hypothetical protein